MRLASLFLPPAALIALLMASMPPMVRHCLESGQALPATVSTVRVIFFDQSLSIA